MKIGFFVKWGLFLILFLIGFFCYMKDYGYCDQYHIPLQEEYLYQNCDCRVPWQARPNRPLPDRSQRQKWQDAYDDHHFNAVRTYTDAYNKIWWLPNLTWRQIGRDCWVSACGLAATNSPTQALIVCFSTLLSQYGLHCLDEWDYIEEKLSWSKYHFDQCVHYAGLLNK